jgi:hypothetical protein
VKNHQLKTHFGNIFAAGSAARFGRFIKTAI